jgi:hypothetical protein
LCTDVEFLNSLPSPEAKSEVEKRDVRISFGEVDDAKAKLEVVKSDVNIFTGEVPDAKFDTDGKDETFAKRAVSFSG